MNRADHRTAGLIVLTPSFRMNLLNEQALELIELEVTNPTQIVPGNQTGGECHSLKHHLFRMAATLFQSLQQLSPGTSRQPIEIKEVFQAETFNLFVRGIGWNTQATAGDEQQARALFYLKPIEPGEP